MSAGPRRTQAVHFTGHSGQRLAARLEEPDGPARGTALFAHCFTCSKDLVAAVRISRGLAAAGWRVLRFDFTGLGQAEGDFADTHFSSDVGDLLSAARWMAEEHGAPALLVGHSLGGAACLAAAGKLPEVRAVVTIGAPSEPAHLQRHFDEGALARIETEGEATVHLGGRPFQVRQAFLDDLAEWRLREHIAALGRPLLILHSPADGVVDISEATRIFMAAKHPKSFVSLDQADHLLTDPRDARWVAGLIAAWAERFLQGPQEHPTDAEDRSVG